MLSRSGVLCFETDRIDGRNNLPIGLGIPPTAGTLGDGLMVELRITTEGEGKLLVQKPIRSTLVVRGELKTGQLESRSIWRVGIEGGWEDQGYTAVKWRLEDQFLSLFDEGRAEGWPDSRELKSLAAKATLTQEVDRKANHLVWLMSLPIIGTQSRLPGILLRILVHSILLFVAIAPFFVAIFLQFDLPIVIAAAFGFVLLLPGMNFTRFFLTEFFQMTRFSKSMLGSIYAEPRKSVLVSEREPSPILDSIFVRRAEKELRHLEFQPFCRFRIAHEAMSGTEYLVLRSPDGMTFAQILGTAWANQPNGKRKHEIWPAGIMVVFTTFFPNGGYATTVGDYGLAFLAKRSGPECSTWYLPLVQDFIELRKAHHRHLNQFMKKMDLQPLAISTISEYLRRSDDAQENARQHYLKRPYTMMDGLCQFFLHVRRCYRES